MKLLLALLLPASPLPAATVEDSREAVRAVLAYEAGRVERGRATCVVAQMGPPLEGERALEGLLAQADAVTEPAAPERQVPSRWLLPLAPAADVDPPRKLDPADSDRFEALLGELLAAPSSGSPMRIDPTLLSPPLHAEGAVRRCDTLTLGAPAFAGDVAFVETGTNCGDLCGGGALYALVRHESGWRVAAVAYTWVS